MTPRSFHQRALKTLAQLQSYLVASPPISMHSNVRDIICKMEGESQDQKPTPDSLCSVCRSLTGESLLKTRPFQWGTHYMHYNEAGDLEEERIAPADPGIYYSILLTNPAASVKTCAACRLFHNAVHGGITLSEPTTLRVCLRNESVGGRGCRQS